MYGLYKSTHSLVGFLASLVGLAAVLVWAVGLFTDATWLTSAFVCVVGLGSVVTALWMQSRYYEAQASSQRGRQLVGATDLLAKHLEHLRDAVTYAGMPEHADKVRQEGDRALARLAEAFTALTAAPCRATVKHIYAVPGEDGEVADDAEAAVRDLFRSHEPSEHHHGAGGPDLVRQNTDFEEVLANELRPWMTGDITREAGYCNSHITRQQLAAGDVPYRAVLVVAISGHGGAVDKAPSGRRELLGFLCVDSASQDIFRVAPDVSLAIASANALYSILKWFQLRQPPQEVGS